MKDKRILEFINNATVENGVKLFTFDHFVDAAPRPVSPDGQASENGQQDAPASDSGEGEAAPDHAAAGRQSSNGEVKERWRLLSAVQAWPSMGWMPALVDYADDGGKVIKQIKPLVNSSTPDLMKNHTDDVNAIVGRIENGTWEDSTDIPPGVNADLVIDPQFDSKAAYALQNGIYRSGSIGITGQFKKSHPDMDDYEFMTKQGKKVDGQIVRFIPVKITGVRHMAIVASGHGADPNSGPRDQNAASNFEGQKNESSTGGTSMLTDRSLLNEVLGLLKLDKLIDNAPVPDGYKEKVVERITMGNKSLERSSYLEGQLQNLGEGLKGDGAVGLTADEVLNLLPERLEKAKAGDLFLVDQRKAAIKWFDSAKADPSKKEQLSDIDKKIRARIENSIDLEFLAEQLAHYKEIAEVRLGLNRSSEAESLERSGEQPKTQNPNISKSAKKMFGGGETK